MTHVIPVSSSQEINNLGDLMQFAQEIQAELLCIPSQLDFLDRGSALHSSYVDMLYQIRQKVSSLIDSIINDVEQGKVHLK